MINFIETISSHSTYTILYTQTYLVPLSMQNKKEKRSLSLEITQVERICQMNERMSIETVVHCYNLYYDLRICFRFQEQHVRLLLYWVFIEYPTSTWISLFIYRRLQIGCNRIWQIDWLEKRWISQNDRNNDENLSEIGNIWKFKRNQIHAYSHSHILLYIHLMQITRISEWFIYSYHPIENWTYE